MSDKLTKKDREFLESIGVSANGHKASEPAPDTRLAFSPEDMQTRAARLKAEGKMPSLIDVLRIVREAGTKHGPN